MSTTIDQQFVEFVVKSLVSKPDAVEIKRTIDEKGVLLELTVDPEDLGRVIGKRGATAQSLRTLLRALGTKNDARYNLKIVDNGEGGYERAPRREEERRDEPAQETTEEAHVEEQVTESEDNNTEDAWAPPTTEEKQETEREEAQDDVVSRTRKELEDLDDLDV
jgi:uncharacterized protein